MVCFQGGDVISLTLDPSAPLFAQMGHALVQAAPSLSHALWHRHCCLLFQPGIALMFLNTSLAEVSWQRC